MTDCFDATRHRVWAVDITHSYRTYVVAETADDAEAVGDIETVGDTET